MASHHVHDVSTVTKHDKNGHIKVKKGLAMYFTWALSRYSECKGGLE